MTFTSKKLQGQVTRKSYHTSFPVSTMLFSLVFLSLSNRILLRDVDVITLYHDKFAQSRKGYRLPQLKCVGGSGFKHPQYYPKVVQCYNRGFDGRDVQWECKAELDKSASFGAVNVNCEGYDYPEDEYIVYGSCAVSILMFLSPYEMYCYLLYLTIGSRKHFFNYKLWTNQSGIR
ncbi:unnamed protein product [Schistosoma margrebowiei]|uniref:Store-operated calcium entry-associated regulatory factor n=1 Tax=Schistosoma margrebowiei TaxID=48269 RepID=A0A183N8Q1_9TREM|nr:unnamed protein product [Schistosoma margrebowiei]